MLGKPFNQRLLLALLAVLTVSGMALFFNLYDPWMPIGPERIIDGGFETKSCTAEWTGWENDLARIDASGGFNSSAGAVLSTTPKRRGRLQLDVIETANIPAFKVSARASTEDVQCGEKSWHHPRAAFYYLDNESGKPLYHLAFFLFNIKQDAKWRQYTAVFPVPEKIQTARLQIQNSGTEGTLRIDDVSVLPVTPKPSAPFFNLFFAILWLSVLVACLAVLRPWKKWTGTGALLCSLVIIIGVILPGEMLDTTISSTFDALSDIKQKIERPAKQPADTQSPSKPGPAPGKIVTITKQPEASPRTSVQNAHTSGHFILFTVLALLSMLCWAPAQEPAIRILYVLGGLCLFAAATEVLQFVTFDRKAGLKDLLIDLSGISIAMTTTTLLTLPARMTAPRKKSRHSCSGA